MLLKLIVKHPRLLLTHAQAYADLAMDETRRLTRRWRNRAVLYGLGMICFCLGLIFGGVALMLWSALPNTSEHTSWILLALPMGCVAVGVAFFATAQDRTHASAFAEVQAQIKLDMLVLREAQSSRTA